MKWLLVHKGTCIYKGDKKDVKFDIAMYEDCEAQNFSKVTTPFQYMESHYITTDQAYFFTKPYGDPIKKLNVDSNADTIRKMATTASGLGCVLEGLIPGDNGKLISSFFGDSSKISIKGKEVIDGYETYLLEAIS